MLLLGLLVLVAVGLTAAEGRRPIGLVAAPLYAWIAWLALSSLWSPSGEVGGYVTDLILLTVGFMLTVHAARTVPPGGLDLVWPMFLVAGVIYLGLALASGTTAQGRLTVPGGGPNVFVRVMVIASIAAIVIAIQRRATWPLWLVLPLAVGAVMSGSRGGLLGGLLVAILAGIPLFLRLKGAARVLTILFGTGLAFLGWAFFRQAGPVVAVTEFVRNRFIEETLVEGYASGRDVISLEALRIFSEHQAAGAGLGAWDALQMTGVEFAHPHNLFLSSGVDGGMVAVAILLVALVVPIGVVLSSRCLNVGAWASLAVALAVFVSAMFSGYYYDSRIIWFFLIWAVAYAGNRRPSKSVTDVSLESRRHLNPPILGSFFGRVDRRSAPATTAPG